MISNALYSISIDLGRNSISKNNDSLEHMKYAQKQVSTVSNTLAEDKVSISKEAFSALNQKLQENTSETSKSTIETSINDKNIENIKKQMEALKQQINQLKYDKSEKADRMRRQLQNQVNALNASLLDLLGKKLSTI